MKKIAIIGANEFQNPLILKAKELGYETHVFAWKTGAVGEKTADVFYDISIVEKEKILEVCKQIGISGVVSIGSDVAVKTVNYILRKLGLNTNTEESDHIATNKYAMRCVLHRGGVFSPAFCLADDEFDLKFLQDFKYPLIIKPTDRSGSRGIFKVYNRTEVEKAINKAREVSFEGKAIVEEFFEGEEYSCESISYNGKHTILAFTKKYTTGEPHFIETGHVQPSGLTEIQQRKVSAIVKKSLDILQIKYGASHAEFRINAEGEIMLMEVGARMGGDCIGSDLVLLSTGYDYMGMVIDIGCGHAPSFKRGEANRKAEIRFIFNRNDLEEFEHYIQKNNKGIFRSFVSEENLENVVNSSAERKGFYILVTK